jgi:hypothetical protein
MPSNTFYRGRKVWWDKCPSLSLLDEANNKEEQTGSSVPGIEATEILDLCRAVGVDGGADNSQLVRCRHDFEPAAL